MESRKISTACSFVSTALGFTHPCIFLLCDCAGKVLCPQTDDGEVMGTEGEVDGTFGIKKW